MNDDFSAALLKRAKLQTILDCLELLQYLRTECSSTHYERIDDMILRLTNMAQTL